MAIAEALLTLGCLFLAGLATDLLGRRTALPRVTLLLLLGVAVGPAGLDLLPDDQASWYPLVSTVALVMVGFLLGGELTLASLGRYGRPVIVVSLAVVLATVATVAFGLLLLGNAAALALLVAAVATATDPVAVSDVVREARAEGAFSRTLLGVVVVDDAWGLVAFSLLFAVALVLAAPADAGFALMVGVRDLGGATLLGLLLGVPMALLTGRLRPGEPTQSEALGGVLLCAGLALWLDVSFLLASMMMGFVVTNLARHHRRPFRAIEGIEWPFMVLFFVLSGASFRFDLLDEVGALAAAYVGLRVVGRIVGGWIGARLAGTPAVWGRWLGLALLPQAGVALGMALVVSERLPEVGRVVVSAVVATTVLFELVGPVLTRRALRATREAV